MSALLELEGVTALRGGRHVLNDVTLQVENAEIVALLGPSGSGKSTIVRLLLGLETPECGRVRIGGEVASEDGKILVPPRDRGLAVVFQDLALWPHLTVAGHLRFVLEAAGVKAGERAMRIDAMLERVGLATKASRRPGDLSGGERQRVAIARALVVEPAAILLDEPLANVDVVLAAELLALLAELLGDRRTAALHVTHDPREALRLTNRLAVLEAGRLVQDGSIQALAEAPATPFVERLLEVAGVDGDTARPRR